MKLYKDMNEETDAQSTKSEQIQPQKETPFILFLLFSYLYFVQGVIIGITQTMPYIYPQLPNVHIMALFHATTIPYSLKFLLGPFLEKHSNIQYGKRKTWIIISQSLAGITLFIGSFYTQLQYAHFFAVLSMVIMIGIVLQNIALHSLIVKEITDAHKSSMIQSWSEVFGILVGGLILLKFTSHDFATKIGLQRPITTPQVVITCFCALIVIPLLIIHFKFKQRILQSERRGTKYSFCQILSYFKVFKNTNTKYFRFCVIALVHNQGLNFFASLIDYELVKAGFSRDTMNTIGNIIIIPIIILTFWFSQWTKRLGGSYQSVFLTTISILILSMLFLFYFPLNPWIFGIYTFAGGLLDAWRFFVFGAIINEFPLHALSGMYITLLGSFYNLGYQKYLHTQICGLFGWRTVSWLGMILQIFLMIYLKKMWLWMQQGIVEVPEQIKQVENQQAEQQFNENIVPIH